MARKGGLGVTALKSAAAENESPESSLVSTVRAGDVQRVMSVSLEDLADNPDNPPARVEDVAELAESMAQVGQMQPGIVVAASAFAAAFPQHADAVGAKRWVLLAGHRRKAAALAAGLTHLEVIERASDRMDEAVLHENMHRRALSPIEEAEAFARVMKNNGLSQRDMAKHAGVSQSLVAKRLKLLELPAEFKAAVARGAIAPSVGVKLVRDYTPEALGLAAEKADEVGESASEWQVERLAQDAEARLKRDSSKKAAQERAEREGVTFVKDASRQFGGALYEHELRTAEEIEQARESGDLAYGPSPYAVYNADDDGVRAFRLTKKPAAAKRDEAAQREAREKKEAVAARKDFMAAMVSRKPKAADVSRALTMATLVGVHLGGSTTTAARKLAQAAGVGPQDEDDWPWREKLTSSSEETQTHLAWITALAALEERLRAPYLSTWDEAACSFMQILTDAGYEPTPYEKKKLKEKKA